MRNRNQVIAVVIKQYGTGLYRTCVSLDKDDVTFLSTHKDERSANETITLFWRAFDGGKLKTPEDVSLFINSIQPVSTTQTDFQPTPPSISAAVPPAVTEMVFTPLAA